MILPACFTDPKARVILSDLCKENDISVDLIQHLYRIATEYLGSGRPDGITDDIAVCLAQYSRASSYPQEE